MQSPEAVLLGLASIIVLGIGAQWLAWRIKVPSILLLLIFGFLAGPFTGFLNPDELFGQGMIGPIVSLSIGIILFEGGLSLRITELREIGKTVRNLITIGIGVTWTLIAIAAHYVAGFNLGLSILIGAILVVTGPTVIVPLLRHVRPTGRIGATARWEGIMNDPIGAILAVIVLEGILLIHESVGNNEMAPGIAEAFGSALRGLVEILFISVGAAVVGALFLVVLLRRRLIPDFLQNSVALMAVVAVFVASDSLQAESGLMATTLMGVMMANQRYVTLQRIAAYKEDLRVLLIGGLFILLSARLDPAILRFIDTGSLVFLGALILIVRPAAVFLSALGSRLNWKEQAFLMWLAPRGIVAAAVASLFSLRLEGVYPQESQALVAIVFLVVAATVALYGLTITPLARWLGLAQPNPQGVLFVGAETWVQKIAECLRGHDIEVLLTDTNPRNVKNAEKKGLPAQTANVLSETGIDELDLGRIGNVLATTSNNEVNSLAALHFADVIGSTNVYQLSTVTRDPEDEEEGELPEHLRGLPLFGGDETYTSLKGRFQKGAVVKAVEVTDEFSYDWFEKEYGKDALPLFLISTSGSLKVYSEEHQFSPEPGQLILAVVSE